MSIVSKVGSPFDIVSKGRSISTGPLPWDQRRRLARVGTPGAPVFPLAETPPTWITRFQSGDQTFGGVAWSRGGGGTSGSMNFTGDFAPLAAFPELGTQPTQCAQLITNGAGGTGDLRCVGFTPTLDMTNRAFVVIFKVIGAQANMNDIIFSAGNGGVSPSTMDNRYQWEFAQSASQWFATTDVWIKATLFFEDTFSTTGVLDRTLINSFRVRCTDTGGVPFEFRWQAIGYIDLPTTFPNGAVALTFDDGETNTLTVAKPELDVYGWKASEFAIAGTIGSGGSYMSASQLRELRDAGWTVSPHGFAVNTGVVGFPALANDAAIAADMDAARERFFELGLNPNWISYPFGEYDLRNAGELRADDEAATRFTAARTNNEVSIEAWPPDMPARMRSLLLGSGDTAAGALAVLDKVKAARSFQPITLHDLVVSGATGSQFLLSEFQALLKGIYNRGMTVVSLDEALRIAQGGTPDLTLMKFTKGTFARSTEASLEQGSVLAWYNVNIPRIRSDGMWLFEGPATNLMALPETITAAGGWTATNSAGFGTENAYVAPDGTLTADGVTLATGSGSRIQKTVTAVLNTIYTSSIYARSVLDTTGARINILAQGGVEAVGPDTSLTSAWKRVVSAAVTSGAVGTTYSTRIHQLSTAGVAGTIGAWGAQVEARSFPSSYIRSGVARGGDTLSIAAGSVPAILTSGRWEFDVVPLFASTDAAALGSSTYGHLFSFPAGGSVDGISWFETANRIRIATGGIIRLTISSLVVSRGQKVTIGVDMTAGELTLSGFTSGNGVYSFGTGFTFDASSGVNIGTRAAGAGPAFSFISEPRAW